MNSRFRLLFPIVLLLVFLLTVAVVAAEDYDYDYIYVSATVAGTTEDGLAYGPGDILASQGIPDSWYSFFDASDAGLGNHNISAFDFPNPMVTANVAFSGPIYMSFSNRSIRVPGIAPLVASNDIVVWQETLVAAPADNYELYFDGSDVGLSTVDEGVNSLSVFTPDDLVPGEVNIPGTCSAGLLFITTNANYRVPAAGGGSLAGPGGDVLAFCATNLGPSTAGFWYRAFSAAQEGLSPNRAIRNISVHDFDTGPAPYTDPWYLEFSFTSRTNFTLGLFEGQADVVYLLDTEGGIEDTLRELNNDFPALNGTADALEVEVTEIICADVSADCS